MGPRSALTQGRFTPEKETPVPNEWESSSAPLSVSMILTRNKPLEAARNRKMVTVKVTFSRYRPEQALGVPVS